MLGMAGYTKLFNSILASSVWQESLSTKVLWITLLALADKNGIAEASVPGLAKIAGLSLAETEAGIVSLSAPDKYSRTKDFDGRRIEACDGGWMVLNHPKYRRKMSADDRREYKRIKQAEYRAKKSTGGQSGHNAKAEAKAEEQTTNGTRAETVAEAAIRLSAQNGYKPEPVSPVEGKLIDQIACKACGKVGHLVTQAPRNGHPVQFYCHQTRGGCGFSIPAKFALDILAQMTPGARQAVEAMIPEAVATQKGRAPSWDRPDAVQAKLEERAMGWIEDQPIEVKAIHDHAGLLRLAAKADYDIRGAVTMILFARNPHIREPAQTRQTQTHKKAKVKK